MGGNLCGGGCVTKKEKEEWRGNEGKKWGVGHPKKWEAKKNWANHRHVWVLGEERKVAVGVRGEQKPKKKKGRKKSQGSDHLGVM